MLLVEKLRAEFNGDLPTSTISNCEIRMWEKIEHAMDVTDTLVLDTGLTYTVSYPFDAKRLEENGVSRSFTLVDGVLTVTLMAAPSETNPVIVYYDADGNEPQLFAKFDYTTGRIFSQVGGDIGGRPDMVRYACDVLEGYADSVREGFGDCVKSYTEKDAEGNVTFYKEEYFG